MVLERLPFTKYNLGEKLDTFTVRLNELERSQLNEIKEYLNIKSDGKALKFAAWIGRNVLHGTFGKDMLKYLFKKDRLKLEDFK